MSPVGWNDSETMYSSGKIEMRGEQAARATSRVFVQVRIPNRPGWRRLSDRRAASRA